MDIKGFIIFYINFPDNAKDITATLDFAKTYNKEVIDKLRDNNYEFMFVPTTNESSRVEKINLIDVAQTSHESDA